MGMVIQAQPERTQDLLAYASLTVHAARKFKGERWAYDRNLRKRATVHPAKSGGTSTWVLAFCNAVPRDHCNLCLSMDHATKECEDYEPPEDKARKQQRVRPRPLPTQREAPPICINWNRASCSSPSCSYQHICLECHLQHRLKDCPNRRRYSPDPRPPKTQENPPFRTRDPPSRGPQLYENVISTCTNDNSFSNSLFQCSFKAHDCSDSLVIENISQLISAITSYPAPTSLLHSCRPPFSLVTSLTVHNRAYPYTQDL